MEDKEKNEAPETCNHEVVLNKRCYFCGEDIDYTTVKKEAGDVVPLDKVKKRK